MEGTILVTGGTGKTARRLLPLLRHGGAAVRAASRNPGDDPGAVGFDWYDPRTWGAALEGVQRLYLVSPALDPEPDRAVVPFLQRARAAGVRHGVLLSAFGVDLADPGEAPLRRVELAVQDVLPEATVLRPNWFMQNFDQGFMQPTIVAQGAFFAPVADAAISFVDTADIAAVAAAALLEDGHAGAEYALTGPEAVTHHRAAAHITAAAGRAVDYVPISDDDFRAALGGLGWPPGYVEMLVYLYGAARAGHAAVVTDTVERVTGRPARSFATFAREAADRWRAVPAPA